MNTIPGVPLSPVRRSAVVFLTIVVMLCASAYWLALGFMAAQMRTGVYGGPELGVAVAVLTFPPALVCTVICLILAGWRRSKLAWISFSSFAWPFIPLLAMMVWAILTHSWK